MGDYNYSYVLHDPYFTRALINTVVLVLVTVPVSTGLALMISCALVRIRKLRSLFQTLYFLPYVTNTLAVGMVFMVLFKTTPYSEGVVNMLIRLVGGTGWTSLTVPGGRRCLSCASIRSGSSCRSRS